MRSKKHASSEVSPKTSETVQHRLRDLNSSCVSWDKTLHFVEQESLEVLLAGDLVGNLKRAEIKLSVGLAARECWLKISASDARGLDRAVRFFDRLTSIQESGVAIRQSDFELVLSAVCGETGADAADLYGHRIKVANRKPDVIPRSRNQKSYVEEIRRHEIVFGVGPAGTGKTYLAMAMAVSMYLEGKFNRIILTRPAVESGERLGFLPGTLEEKVHPYMRPLYDALFDMMDWREVERLIENDVIEVAPLAFMRGRTLNNCFAILDEAQNASVDQMLMFLTRIGLDSKCVVTGDPTQTDLPPGMRSGLSHAVHALRDIEEIRICRMAPEDIVRSQIIEKIILAYAEDRTSQMAGASAERG